MSGQSSSDIKLDVMGQSGASHNICSERDSHSGNIPENNKAEQNEGVMDANEQGGNVQNEPRNADFGDGQRNNQNNLNNDNGCWKKWWNVVMVLTVALLITRLFLLALFFVVFVDCLGNYSTTATCRDFNRIPNREAFESLLPLLSIITSVLWLAVLHNVEQEKPTYTHIAKRVVKKLYFWRFFFAWLVVLAYHFSVVHLNLGLQGSYLYIFWPFEETMSAILMFVSNFRKGPTDEDNRNFKFILQMFKAVLLMVAIENAVISVISTIYISLKVLTLPSEFADNSNYYTAVNLIFLVVNFHYRWRLADYFMMKVFLGRKDNRILLDVGDKTSTDITEEDNNDVEAQINN